MSEVKILEGVIAAQMKRDYRYEIYQFNLPSVSPGAKGDVFAIKSPSFGVITKLRSICDSEKIELVYSSSKDIDDIRQRIMVLETEGKDYSYDYHNGDFMQFFFLNSRPPMIYVRAENKGGSDTGVICCTVVYGS